MPSARNAPLLIWAWNLVVCRALIEREEQLAAMASIRPSASISGQQSNQQRAGRVAASPSNDIKEPHRDTCLSDLVGAVHQLQNQFFLLWFGVDYINSLV